MKTAIKLILIYLGIQIVCGGLIGIPFTIIARMNGGSVYAIHLTIYSMIYMIRNPLIRSKNFESSISIHLLIMRLQEVSVLRAVISGHARTMTVML